MDVDVVVLSMVSVVVVIAMAEVVAVVELSVHAAQQISTRTSHFWSKRKLLAVEN